MNDDEFDDPMDFLNEVKIERVVPDIIKPWMIYHKFTRVKSIDHLKSIIDESIKRGACSLDLETQGLDNRIVWNEDGTFETVHKIVGYCLCYDIKEGFYVPVRHKPTDGGPSHNLPLPEVEAEITRLCVSAIPEGTEEAKAADPLSWKPSSPPKMKIYFWNAQFDQEFLYPVTGIDWWHPDSFEDGMLAAFTKFAADKRIGLKYKAKELLRDPDGNPYEMIELKELFNGKKKDIKFDTLAPDEPAVLRYTGSDAICTFMLCELPELVPECRKNYSGTYRLEQQTSCVLRAMERNRVYIERSWVRAELEKQSKKREGLLKKIQDFAFEQLQVRNLDPNSPKQLSEFLFGPKPKGLDITPKPEKNEASGQYKTDESALSKLAEAPNAPSILKNIMEFRGVEKYISTYLSGLANNPDENSELRFSFKQTGAGTGRFSAPGGMPDHGYSGIPIHGIPGGSEIRRVFKARKGFTMVKADYAGEELRIAANISKEPVWIKEFLEGSGDLHSITARAFFGKSEVTKEERSGGKTANFALLYGGGPKSIVRATNCSDMEARRRKQAFDKSVPVFSSWIKKQHKDVKKNLGVWTAFGRWLAIPDANHVDKMIRAACERHAVNYQIQGCISYDTPIQTSKGYRKIGELHENKETLRVWTGSKWAEAHTLDMGKWEMAQVVLEDGTTIDCDTRHQIMEVTEEGYRWVSYESLKPGMKIASSFSTPVEYETPLALPQVKPSPTCNANHFQLPGNLKDLWYWLGRYMGDGNLDSQTLRYHFGDHENAAVESCRKFWGACGLPTSFRKQTHTPCNKESTRCSVVIYSVELSRWLQTLGFELGKTAHTKRVPQRLFGETLDNRLSFIRGMMESDGCIKDGVKARQGQQHSIHLCQRGLLEDFQLLFHSVGVGTRLCGPYTYTNKNTELETKSFRLDISTRSYGRAINGSEQYRSRSNSLAPQFLVQELLDQERNAWNSREFFPDESSYVLYRRLATGGRVSISTFKELCEILGVTLSNPLYDYKVIKKLHTTGMKENTYTLFVKDPEHRYDAQGVITKNCGADIMKIALVLLHKEFYKRGWLRTGGDDSIRMLLTVHDEVVLEIKNELVTEVVPIIVDTMEHPWRIAKNWKVPLVVEPLIGFNWASGFDAFRVKSSYEPKPTEVVVNGFAYSIERTPKKDNQSGKIIENLDQNEQEVDGKFHVIDPPWLKGHLLGSNSGPNSSEPSLELSQPISEIDHNEEKDVVSVVDLVPEEKTTEVKSEMIERHKITSSSEEKVLHLTIERLTEQTADQMVSFVLNSGDAEGPILHVVDLMGETLISPDLKLRVDKKALISRLTEYNLLSAEYDSKS